MALNTQKFNGAPNISLKGWDSAPEENSWKWSIFMFPVLVFSSHGLTFQGVSWEQCCP